MHFHFQVDANCLFLFLRKLDDVQRQADNALHGLRDTRRSRVSILIKKSLLSGSWELRRSMCIWRPAVFHGLRRVYCDRSDK